MNGYLDEIGTKMLIILLNNWNVRNGYAHLCTVMHSQAWPKITQSTLTSLGEPTVRRPCLNMY